MAWLGGEGWDVENNGYLDIRLAVAGDAPYDPTDFTGGLASVTPFNTGGSFNQATAVQYCASSTFANTTTLYTNFYFWNQTTAIATGLTTTQGGVRFYDGSSLQCGVYIRTGGDLIITNGEANGTILATSSKLLNDRAAGNVSGGAWDHIQLKVVFNNTTGSVAARVNGATSDSWSATGLNTRNGSANNYANKMRIGGATGNTGGCIWDDWMWFDDTGAEPNTWTGIVRCLTVYPSTDSSVQWSRLSQASNYLNVNELYDEDTSYVYDNTVGHVDKYGHAALANTPNKIYNVQASIVARHDDAGPHTVKIRLTSNVTSTDSADMILNASYARLFKNYLVDPNTGVAWTKAGIDAATFGPYTVL